jgi:tRNA threonylcarbamoyladenosine biosynthesis protein TsaB
MILGIETSDSAMSVCIVDGESSLASIEILRPNLHDEWLPTALQHVFAFSGITADTLDAVAVSSGPGSFTGLRIGMAAAKGIALASGVPLITVPSFDAMAQRAARHLRSEIETSFAAVLDARKDDVYAGIFSIHNAEITCMRSAFADTAENVAAMLESGTFLLGSGAEKLVAYRSADFVILDSLTPATHAYDVALTGAGMLSNGETADIASCEPMYVREFKTTSPKSKLTLQKDPEQQK